MEWRGGGLRFAMRIRFSLRVILVGTATLSILLYLFVVRPTSLANRFVAAVNAQDMDAVDAFLADSWRKDEYSVLTRDAATRTDHIYADLFPRDWSDWLGCRRRIVLRIARQSDSNGRHTEWSEDIDLVSRATGISIWPPDHQF
jgi:hypothetical protein